MANYADTNAAKLVAAHIIGKSFITAPLGMGEDIADVSGPAHDSASFGSRLAELAATGPDGKGTKLINNWDISTYNSVVDNRTLFCVPETMYEIGDTVFYSVSQNKLVKKSYSEVIGSNNDDSSYLDLIPVGIIVIPTSLDIYGNGSALMASIRPLDPYSTARFRWTGQYWDDNTSQYITLSDWEHDEDANYDHNPGYGTVSNVLSYGMYWANWGKASTMRFYTKDATSILNEFDSSYKVIMISPYSDYGDFVSSSPCMDCVSLTTSHVYTGEATAGGTQTNQVILPVNRTTSINSTSGDLRGYNTSGALIKQKIASPIAIDSTSGRMSQNPNYFTPASWTVRNTVYKNAMTDFNGYANTQKLQKLNEGYDWKTIAEHQTHESSSYLSVPNPIAAKMWEFYTPGTNRGDWYIPSVGEMAFATIYLSKYYEPADGTILTKLINIYTTLGVTYQPASQFRKTNVLHGVGNTGTYNSDNNRWSTSSVIEFEDDDEITGMCGYWQINSYTGDVTIRTPADNVQWVLPVMRIR